MNVTGQQSLILAGERPADDRGSGSGAIARLALPSGGAVLQRVTVVTSRPGDNVVLLRADYATPGAAARYAGTTYEGLAGRASANDPVLAQRADGADGSRADGAGGARPDGTRSGARPTSALSPAAQYSLTQERGSAVASRKGSLIDVMA